MPRRLRPAGAARAVSCVVTPRRERLRGAVSSHQAHLSLFSCLFHVLGPSTISDSVIDLRSRIVAWALGSSTATRCPKRIVTARNSGNVHMQGLRLPRSTGPGVCVLPRSQWQINFTAPLEIPHARPFCPPLTREREICTRACQERCAAVSMRSLTTAKRAATWQAAFFARTPRWHAPNVAAIYCAIWARRARLRR